jgi:DNA-binding transcriptional regulator/RsmH inhibitor MraZ
MKTAKLDAKRRLTMPADLAPGAAVSVEALDADNWLVKRLHPDRELKVVVVPSIKRLADDSKWERVERKLARAAQVGLPEPE